MLKKTPIWTWIVPSGVRKEIPGWRERGGKWLVYGDLGEMKRLALEIDRFVEGGVIPSAKFWNASTTSAMCVYSLDLESKKTLAILSGLGVKPTAWEYDYARSKNWMRPRFFLSAFYKLRVLLSTFGFRGALRFIWRAYS